MRVKIEAEVDAPPAVLWAVLTDLRRWPDWIPSIRSIELLDAPFGPSARVRITQPKLRPTVYTVSTFEPDSAFDWVATTPGVTTRATHDVTPLDGGRRSGLTLGIEQHGALAPIVKLMAGRLIRRYVQLETTGLKAAAEHHAFQPTSDSESPRR
jgi:carbon monoxide dehydrogenase subunit G